MTSAAENIQQITFSVSETAQGPVLRLEGAASIWLCCLMQPFLMPTQQGP